MNIQYSHLPATSAPGQPGSSHASLSAHEQRELDDLIRGNYDILGQQSAPGGSGGGDHVIPHSNHGNTQVKPKADITARCVIIRRGKVITLHNFEEGHTQEIYWL